MGWVIFNPSRANAHANRAAASDFYERHPDWNSKANPQTALIPVTGENFYPDYVQRHPELSNLATLGLGASDYFERHPELIQVSKTNADLADYYSRHPGNRSIP